MSKEAAPTPEPGVLAEIRQVVDRAKRGDATVLRRLRELLVEFPTLAARYGDLAAQAAGPDLYLRECLLAKAAALKAELGGPAPAPVERLLIERAVACWFQVNYFASIEARGAGSDESPRLALYRGKRQEQAQRAYLTALGS